eukprot:gene9774-11992_t
MSEDIAVDTPSEVNQYLEDEDDALGALGFMFDACHARLVQEVHVGLSSPLRIVTIGDQPGHRQSGHFLWPAGTALSRYLVAHWQEELGKELGEAGCVLELGAGCGVPSIALSQLPEVSVVVSSDHDQGTLDLLGESMRLNGGQHKARTALLRWGDVKTARELVEAHCASGFPLVVGGDLLYCKEAVRPLVRTAAACLAPRGCWLLSSSFRIGE